MGGRIDHKWSVRRLAIAWAARIAPAGDPVSARASAASADCRAGVLESAPGETAIRFTAVAIGAVAVAAIFVIISVGVLIRRPASRGPEMKQAVAEASPANPVRPESIQTAAPATQPAPLVKPAVQQPGEAGAASNDIERIAKTIGPSVVTIETKTKQGSGFFVDSAGTIITNFHVVEGETSASILLPDGRVVEVLGFVAVSRGADLAALRVAPFTGMPKPLKLASRRSAIGEGTVAIGSHERSWRGTVEPRNCQRKQNRARNRRRANRPERGIRRPVRLRHRHELGANHRPDFPRK